jgi:integrase
MPPIRLSAFARDPHKLERWTIFELSGSARPVGVLDDAGLFAARGRIEQAALLSRVARLIGMDVHEQAEVPRIPAGWHTQQKGDALAQALDHAKRMVRQDARRSPMQGDLPIARCHQGIREYAAAGARAGVSAPNPFSAHSLRSGLATSAIMAGTPFAAVQRHGRWQDRRSLERYIRHEPIYDANNPAKGLL